MYQNPVKFFKIFIFEPFRTSQGISPGTLRNLFMYLDLAPPKIHYVTVPETFETLPRTCTKTLWNFQNLTSGTPPGISTRTIRNFCPEAGVVVAPDWTSADLAKAPIAKFLLLGKNRERRVRKQEGKRSRWKKSKKAKQKKGKRARARRQEGNKTREQESRRSRGKERKKGRERAEESKRGRRQEREDMTMRRCA